MKIMCISNNPLIIKKNLSHVKVINGDFLEVLQKTRDEILRSNKLVTHPLTGNISPKVVPYKSIILENGSGQIDYESLQIVNKAIAYVTSLIEVDIEPCWDEASLVDFQAIDFDFVKDFFGGIL